ncbi:EboA domain-containing protein [Georgenia satyanarayanai]|uniref:EboA domain-containing protein n=1 Tax=Georgenia satyanarayanai TaxID=860221 RepID=UPI00186B0377|nr:EboA domain-containing protein [Georgenia satyanarayanai]
MSRTQQMRDAIAADLSPAAASRLSQMTAEIAADPSTAARLFPAAAREVARGPLDHADPSGIHGPTLDDAVRGVLLAALAESLGDHARLLREVSDLYRYGDGDEKRAVLRALDLLGPEAQPIVEDALRTNDIRIVAAAMGAWAGAHLDDATWRQGVLKCLFVGVPLTAVDRLGERTDPELARMVAAYAHERLAAGRSVPDDVHLVLDQEPQALDQFPDVAAALRPSA